MLRTVRGRLVDVWPRLARVVGGYYPHLPTRLWEFSLTTNRHDVVTWTGTSHIVTCTQTSTGVWMTTLDDDVVQEEHESFKKALAEAYGLMAMYSVESDLHPTTAYPPARNRSNEETPR